MGYAATSDVWMGGLAVIPRVAVLIGRDVIHRMASVAEEVGALDLLDQVHPGVVELSQGGILRMLQLREGERGKQGERGNGNRENN